MAWKRLLVLVSIVSLGATAAIAIGILLLGDFGETEARVLGTTFGIAVAGQLGLPAAVLLEQGRAAPLAWVTVTLAAVWFAAFEITVWGAEESEDGWKIVGTLLAAAVASTQISAVTSRLRAGDSGAVRAAYVTTVGLPIALAVMVVDAIWNEIESEGFYRALAALAVLNVFLIIVQPLLRRLTPQAGGAFRVRLATEPGGSEEQELSGRDFADALATAVRKLERQGRTVTRIDRL